MKRVIPIVLVFEQTGGSDYHADCWGSADTAAACCWSSQNPGAASSCSSSSRRATSVSGSKVITDPGELGPDLLELLLQRGALVGHASMLACTPALRRT